MQDISGSSSFSHAPSSHNAVTHGPDPSVDQYSHSYMSHYHPAPNHSSTQYDSTQYDQDEQHQYGGHPDDAREDGNGNVALVPDSQEEQEMQAGEEEEEEFMQDLARLQPQGEEGAHEDQRYYEYNQRDEAMYQGHEGEEGQDTRILGEEFGNGTPIGLGGQGEEGALQLYNGGNYQADYEDREAYSEDIHATQVDPERRRDLKTQLSVRMADEVEEPTTPMTATQALPPTEEQPRYELHSSPPPSKPHPIASARAKGQFVPPQRAKLDTAAQEHVAIEDIGGRRVLTKQAGMKRQREDWDLEGGEERRMGVEPKAENFDPTAEIVKFDAKKMLVNEWDKIQGEIVPFLKGFVEAKMEATYNEIMHVNNLFHQLNEDARIDLEEGAKRIEDEEKKQEACRKVIVDFSAQMQTVAAALSQFGGGAPHIQMPGQASQAGGMTSF